MIIRQQLQLLFIWMIAFVCFAAGFYRSLNYTYQLFDVNNYLFAPFGDDAYDAAKIVYPFLLGKLSWTSLFQPFAEHRVFFERLNEIIDFVFTQGQQMAQPYRLSVALWSVSGLFIYFVILKNTLLNNAIKLLLSGISLALTFSAISIVNYSSSILITWPYVLLFSLIVFILTAHYCEAAKANSNKKGLFYIFFVATFVIVTMFVFNIGLILWPIVFVVLFKHRCIRKHLGYWLVTMIFTYALYFYGGWQFQTVNGGVENLFFHPVEFYLYVSRILSLPLIPMAQMHASVGTIIIATSVFLLSTWCLCYFLMKKYWSKAETILFAYFVFSLLALLIISFARFWLPAEASSIGLRFTTVSFTLMICLLTMIFNYWSRSTKMNMVVKAVLAVLTMIWLLKFFIPNDARMSRTYDAGFMNQFAIVQATGVPIDNHFSEAIKAIQSDNDMSHILFLNKIQKEFKKGAYYFWHTQYISKNINELKFDKLLYEQHPNLHITLDFRPMKNPGILIEVKLKNYKAPLSKKWDIFFADESGKIIGFALPAPGELPSLWSRLITHVPLTLYWRGAANTALLMDNRIVIWAVNDKERKLYRIGSFTV